MRVQLPPLATFKCFPGRFGSEIYIRVGGRYSLPHRSFSSRVDNIKRGSSVGINVLSIDKELSFDFGKNL
jgi:hypothetical protein